MYETGKSRLITAEMKKYKINILGICESRWTGSGQVKLSTGEKVLYSGHEEDGAPHTQGVAFMLSGPAQRALIGWEAHCPRIIIASFRTTKKRVNINVIQCDAPTNDADEEEKVNFYQQLQTVVQSRSRRNIMLLLMGDLNAKISYDNRGYEEVMGTQGLGEMNENGDKFADFCATNRLVIGGSIFQHRRIHKATWRSPDATTKNQIDHVCINKRFRGTLQDVRVKRGADVGSDHQLLVAQVKLKLRRVFSGNSSKRQRYNTALLRNATKLGEFQLALSNRFEALQYLHKDDDTLDKQWEGVNETVARKYWGPTSLIKGSGFLRKRCRKGRKGEERRL